MENYALKCCKEALNKIGVVYELENIWVSISKTPDASGREI
jgi:hypothetical protein